MFFCCVKRGIFSVCDEFTKFTVKGGLAGTERERLGIGSFKAQVQFKDRSRYDNLNDQIQLNHENRSNLAKILLKHRDPL